MRHLYFMLLMLTMVWVSRSPLCDLNAGYKVVVCICFIEVMGLCKDNSRLIWVGRKSFYLVVAFQKPLCVDGDWPGDAVFRVLNEFNRIR